MMVVSPIIFGAGQSRKVYQNGHLLMTDLREEDIKLGFKAPKSVGTANIEVKRT
jgi:sRNA-binding carbon storage regulator CsrA